MVHVKQFRANLGIIKMKYKNQEAARWNQPYLALVQQPMDQRGIKGSSSLF